MARFFIDRPVFAMVIAIVTVILGAVAIPKLPIATYPEVVPPVVQITATYRGGNAQDLENTVAQPIEQQLVGLDGMLYFFSRSSNDGVLTIDVTFELGTDIDIATVKTQNKVNLALPSLPPEVQREGVTVKKVSSAFLMAVSIFTDDDRYDSVFLNNYATINLLDQIGSIPGVGEARLVARQDYGMRVWVNPDKMATLGLTATDVSRGHPGAEPAERRRHHRPAADRRRHGLPVSGQRHRPAARARAVQRHRAAGAAGWLAAAPGRRRPRRAGRAGLQELSRFNGKPAAVMMVFLTPGANAVETGKRVRAHLRRGRRRAFPPGLKYRVGYDATRFVDAAITDVVRTLFEAIALVVLVVFVFLQNWRATLIPLLTVPVSIIGTFALFPLLGFSINMTSMFGLVLAIGIVVDDAIVVVEAVQHKIDQGMSPRGRDHRGDGGSLGPGGRDRASFSPRCSFRCRSSAASPARSIGSSR